MKEREGGREDEREGGREDERERERERERREREEGREKKRYHTKIASTCIAKLHSLGLQES